MREHQKIPEGEYSFKTKLYSSKMSELQKIKKKKKIVEMFQIKGGYKDMTTKGST